MPLKFDAAGMVAPVQATYTTKFFDKKLTGNGNGNSVGLLSAKAMPSMVDSAVRTPDTMIDMRGHRSYRNGTTTINEIPFNILTTNAWDLMDEVTIPDISTMLRLTVPKAGQPTVYLKMDAHSATIQETTYFDMSTYKNVTHTHLTICYRMAFFRIADGFTGNKAISEKTHSRSYIRPNKATADYRIRYTCNPIVDFIDKYRPNLVNAGLTVDDKNWNDFINQFDAHAAVAEASERWQTKVDVIMDEFLENAKNNAQKWGQTSVYSIIRHTMKRLLEYQIPLNLYKGIYTAIQTRFTPEETTEFCKQNLNLLLSNTLNNLNNNKQSLVQPVIPANIKIPASVNSLSYEQKKAAMTTEPLTLVQAGAGTGKSTLILGRMDFLLACGIDPNDITVLSFTRNAAGHITANNQAVNSMTIAAMIHNIYKLNFENHRLSSNGTIINSLQIYFDPTVPNKIGVSQQVIDDFRNRLYLLRDCSESGFTEMNNFIEAHYDDVMAILDTIGQTSLELEIIICYQKINELVEPPEIKSKYLIIDEVQDNSVFEFIYTLKYIEKHQESMFIVGDSAQTLYEFRASNPRALNILEGSGVFATYQLDINYRSRQEILDFANIALENIEANQYAHIQLQSNVLTKVTEDSFREAVDFHYMQLLKIGDFDDRLPGEFARHVLPYVKKCLAKGEQVAFLAYTRHHINLIRKIIETMFPNVPADKIVSLIPEEVYDSTIFSEYIMRYWANLKFAPPTSIITSIKHGVVNNIDKLTFGGQKSLPTANKLLAGWEAKFGPAIHGWKKQNLQGQISAREFLDHVKETLIQFEIDNNAARQSLMSQKNNTAKANATNDATFVLSTIHSAKGREFDNTVVIYKNDNSMEEDKKRMYYVAFTRAMKSECVLAYDTTASPQIETDYKTVLRLLHENAPAKHSPITVRPKAKKIAL